jgi:hypothetical protein
MTHLNLHNFLKSRASNNFHVTPLKIVPIKVILFRNVSFKKFTLYMRYVCQEISRYVINSILHLLHLCCLHAHFLSILLSDICIDFFPRKKKTSYLHGRQ